MLLWKFGSYLNTAAMIHRFVLAQFLFFHSHLCYGKTLPFSRSPSNCDAGNFLSSLCLHGIACHPQWAPGLSHRLPKELILSGAQIMSLKSALPTNTTHHHHAGTAQRETNMVPERENMRSDWYKWNHLQINHFIGPNKPCPCKLTSFTVWHGADQSVLFYYSCVK